MVNAAMKALTNPGLFSNARDIPESIKSDIWSALAGSKELMSKLRKIPRKKGQYTGSDLSDYRGVGVRGQERITKF